MKFLIIVATAAILLLVGRWLHNYIKLYGVRNLRLAEIQDRFFDKFFYWLFTNPKRLTNYSYPGITLYTPFAVYGNGTSKIFQNVLKTSFQYILDRIRKKSIPPYPFILEFKGCDCPRMRYKIFGPEVDFGEVERYNPTPHSIDAPILHFKEENVKLRFRYNSSGGLVGQIQELLKFIDEHESDILSYIKSLEERLLAELNSRPLESGETSEGRHRVFTNNFKGFIMNYGQNPTLQEVLEYVGPTEADQLFAAQAAFFKRNDAQLALEVAEEMR